MTGRHDETAATLAAPLPDPTLFAGEDLPAPLAFAVAGGEAVLYTHRAPGKEGPNEDAAAVLPLEAGAGVLAVADGMGGQRGGAGASACAVRALRAALVAAAREGRELRGAILDAIEQANRGLLEQGLGAATTLVAAEIRDATLRPYHVGDAGLLVVGQRGRLKWQTVSHAPVAYAVEAGLIDEREALHHADRHLVTNVIGSPDMRIEVGPVLRLAPYDTVVLASDGLFDNLHLDEIVAAVRKGPLAAAAARLADTCAERMAAPAAARPHKPDDLTFILFRRAPPRRRAV